MAVAFAVTSGRYGFSRQQDMSEDDLAAPVPLEGTTAERLVD
jgi:hypothetical protein